MMSGTLDLQKLLRRESAVTFVCLALVIALSWAYILAGAGMQMDMSAMMARPAWDVGYSLLMFFMWWFMMIAMMLPSVNSSVARRMSFWRARPPERLWAR